MYRADARALCGCGCVCSDVIVGPVSSNYAKTAAVESMLTRGYLTQHGMCAYDSKLSKAAGGGQREVLPKAKGSGHVASTTAFEHSRRVEGMFAECLAQSA